MDFRYGIHTIELFHRVSKKDFNKVFQHLKSVNSGIFIRTRHIIPRKV